MGGMSSFLSSLELFLRLQTPVSSTKKDGSLAPGETNLQLVFETISLLVFKGWKITLLAVPFKA